MKGNSMKIVFTVPIENADAVREAAGMAGAGQVGNYTFCSFSSKGTGRFKPNKDANPAIGKVENYETVEEERVELNCNRDKLSEVINAIKSVHPYEEVALDIYALDDIPE